MQPIALARAALLAASLLATSLFAAAPGQAASFSFNPGALGLSGATFTADALKATEVSHITFTSPTQWFEHGFAAVTGVVQSAVTVVPTGLGTGYSLYFSFDLTGHQVSATQGVIETLSMTLWAAQGVSSFGFDAGNTAIVTNAFAPTALLSTLSLVVGGTGLAPDFSLSATLLGPYQIGNPALVVNALQSTWLFGDFFHPPGDNTPLLDANFNLLGFLVTGGNDTLSFVPAPEPASLAIFGLALAGLAGLRRRG